MSVQGIYFSVSTRPLTNHQMIARVPPQHEFHVGDDAYFEANMDRVIFFDMETEKALNGE